MTVPQFIISAVEDFSIGTRKLANFAVETIKIAAKAVTTEKIADAAITAPLIADAAVGLPAIDEVLDLMTRQLPMRAPVRAATTANLPNVTTSAPLVLDGVTLVLGDRVLLKDQTNPIFNGLYSVSVPGSGSNGTWVRAEDANTDGDLFESIAVYVQEGTANGNKSFRLTSPGTVNIGVDGQTWGPDTSGGVQSTITITGATPIAGGGDLSTNRVITWAPTASVPFNKQQATEFRIENRTTDPTTPAEGQIWLRTDL
jgi:hypothetical protein